MENIPAEFLSDAINDLTEILNELRQINAAGQTTLPPQFSQKLFRTLHTIKGSARTFGFDVEARIAHEIETFLTVPRDLGAKSLFAISLQILTENFRLASRGEITALPENLIKELKSSSGETSENVGRPSLPDNFPAELSGKLSASEIKSISSAWEEKKEILILEFSFDREGFAASFKELREQLDKAARIFAVIAGSDADAENKIAFRFIAASDESPKMIDLLREFGGRVLFQKQKRSGQESAKSTPSSSENESELQWAVLHGEITAGMAGKDVRFVLPENHVQVPISLSRAVSTILLHLVRNAVDHGIEFPLERAARQKPSRGTVEINISVKENDLTIEVCDDGRGSDGGDHIFAAGYSTAPFITEFSGRGIGLDAVLETVDQAGGTIRLKTKPGRGMSFEINLPLEGSAK